MRMLRALFLFLLSPLKLIALYNGNPSFPMMPENGAFISKEYWIGLKAGYLFDDVYDRKLHMTGATPPHSKTRVEEYDSLTNFGVMTLNFNDRVEIFGLLGSMSAELKQHLFSNTKIGYETQTDFAWGVGGRAILAYWGDFQLGVNVSYVRSDLPLSSLKVNGRSFAKKHAEFKFTEWQVGIGISYRFSWFIPYLGVDYSDFRARIDHLNAVKFLVPKKHVTFKEKYPMGVFLGFGIGPIRAMNINLEARLINENAVSLSADFKF